MATPDTSSPWVIDTMHAAQGIRRRVLEYTLKTNEGYLSQALSSAEILSTLYTRVMRLAPSEAPQVPPPFGGVPHAGHDGHFTGAAYNGPHAPHLDRFYLSAAHYALALYAVLVETGRMAPEGLYQFNTDGSTVEMIGADHSPGMELETGSLAQGLSQVAGVALARRLHGEDGRCFIFMSDGEFQEGQTWETFEVLNHHHISRVAAYVDVNGQQVDGRVADVLDTGDLAAKLRLFGAEVHVVDGHDVEALERTAVQWDMQRPLVVLARTNPWQGVDVLRQRNPKFHYVRFKGDEERRLYQDALAALGGRE